MAKEYTLSAERLEELQKELVYLKTDREKSADIVHVGSTVTVRDVEFDEEQTYQIVGSQEADPMNGRISEESPFGRALLGRRSGEEVTVEAPAGSIRYQIVGLHR